MNSSYFCRKDSEMTHSDILQGLNEAQRAAVASFEHPSLIIAGAGSGKTRVLTTRIAYMLANGVKPSSILALTFTNKAAREMRERIERLVGPKARYIRMGTFHSVFARLLRENAERIGYTDSYTIYEPSDCKNLIKTFSVADVTFVELKILACKLLDSVKSFGTAVVEIIYDNDFVTCIKNLNAGV